MKNDRARMDPSVLPHFHASRHFGQFHFGDSLLSPFPASYTYVHRMFTCLFSWFFCFSFGMSDYSMAHSILGGRDAKKAARVWIGNTKVQLALYFYLLMFKALGLFSYSGELVSQSSNDSGKKENKQTITTETFFFISATSGIERGAVKRFIRTTTGNSSNDCNDNSNNNEQQTSIYCTIAFIKTTNDHEMPSKGNT